jgi:hypothetical protein
MFSQLVGWVHVCVYCTAADAATASSSTQRMFPAAAAVLSLIQEYRETTLNAAVDALYSEMASRHRVRAPCIFVSGLLLAFWGRVLRGYFCSGVFLSTSCRRLLSTFA